MKFFLIIFSILIFSQGLFAHAVKCNDSDKLKKIESLMSEIQSSFPQLNFSINKLRTYGCFTKRILSDCTELAKINDSLKATSSNDGDKAILLSDRAQIINENAINSYRDSIIKSLSFLAQDLHKVDNNELAANFILRFFDFKYAGHELRADNLLHPFSLIINSIKKDNDPKVCIRVVTDIAGEYL
jgi:aspartyl-tRNA synthetase